MHSKQLAAFSISLLLVTCALAAWEDAAVPARQVPDPAPAPVRRAPAQAPVRRAPAAPVVRQTPVQTAAQPRRPGFVPPDLYSTFLDAEPEWPRWASVMYTAEAAVGNGEEEMAIGEIAARYKLASWRNILSGDVGVDLRLKSVIFGSDANYDIMPDALLELPLEIDWTWRFLNGVSCQIGARPGLYADVAAMGDGLGVPFKGALYYASSPELSWLFGVEIRPGWNLEAMPLAGLAWEPSDYWRLTLAVPQSTVLLQLGPVGVWGTLAWRNTTYAMSGDDGEPEGLTIEDILVGGGLRFPLGGSVRLALEGGMLFNRTMLAEDSDDEDELDIEDSPYFRVTIGSDF